MKVYFNASLAGKEKYFKEYKSIIKILHDLGHTTYADHVMMQSQEKIREKDKEKYERAYRKAREQIEKSDVMVVEATHSSIEVGHIMSIALEMRKSVLILYSSSETPPGILLGDPDRLLTIKKYTVNKPEKLKEDLDTWLKKAQKKLLRIRLNLMIDKEQEEYLNLIAQVKKISKSDFIRRLIDESSSGNIKL